MIDKIILNKPDIQEQTKLKTLDMSNAYSKSFMPETGGTWTREKGESVWKPNKDDVPKTSNPEGLTWKEIFKKYNIEGIPFKDGYPDFSEVAIETVEIDNFTVSRDDNFKQADQKN